MDAADTLANVAKTSPVGGTGTTFFNAGLPRVRSSTSTSSVTVWGCVLPRLYTLLHQSMGFAKSRSVGDASLDPQFPPTSYTYIAHRGKKVTKKQGAHL